MASPLPPSPVGVRVRAPAKLNLALKVGQPRPDGYHPLATVYQAVSLYDEVHAAWANPEEFEVIVTGEGADLVPQDESNLAVRAAQLLARTHGPYDSLGVSLSIKKSIPVAGGLAGGSSNGAAALLACAVLWDIDISPEAMRSLAAELGSDVPFALLGGTAVGRGRGKKWHRRWPGGPTTGCSPSGTTACQPQRCFGASTSSPRTRHRPRCRQT